MLEPEHEQLVQAMMGFARKIRQAWASHMGSVPGGERLTERDWTLLEWLSEKGEVSFGEAVKFAQGTVAKDDAGGSEAAITAAMGRMSKEWGLLRAKRTKADERKKTVALTEKGRRLIAQRSEIRREMYDKIIQCWQPFDKKDCERMTRLFRNGLKQADEVFESEGI